MKAAIRADVFDRRYEFGERPTSDYDIITDVIIILRLKKTIFVAAVHQPCDDTARNDRRSRWAEADQARNSGCVLDLMPAFAGWTHAEKEISAKNRPKRLCDAAAPAPFDGMARHEQVKP